MQIRVPAQLRAATALLLYTGNTLGCFITISPVILLKALIFHEGIRHSLTRVLMRLGFVWIDINSLILGLIQNLRMDTDGLDGYNQKSSYLIISNHRSWADILVLQHLWKRRIPFLKFFLKKELIWVPFLGIAWWALDFPFMKRYSREFLQKHPELKGRDMETTRRYCERFRKSPISVINFVEGTRFCPEKQQKQQSPYRHLLMPRAGGAAMVLSAMGETLEAIIDVTIVYPENEAPLSFWSFLKGEIPLVVVRARPLSIPPEFVQSGYEQDPDFQRRFRDWINGLWAEKDRQIAEILEQYGKKQTKA
ncbi:MAG: acyltransferase [Desulfosalsimonadaceae bacterium]